ncbi:HIG1 domain family member 2A, mitochondrial [Neodiprion pinetum]|uniref:HIG1 domain family member 2A, mitochondrial n=1 Tax=Neodiprion lecontei TaxID=441921 RepID=A0A6J0C0B6_NEOLC|nr:HIG1 domain family member 2A, mitochondrial [Neodiprion lecontei]XP_046476474.1 HIG1 domain family member 2A, mitochondrial [Neodiprion pinetum]
MSVPNDSLADLDWVKLREDMDNVARGPETFTQKLNRKFRENPLVPIGCFLTTAALSYGLYSFKTGNREMSQYMMRARVVAQGLTVVAFVLGMGAAASRK